MKAKKVKVETPARNAQEPGRFVEPYHQDGIPMGNSLVTIAEGDDGVVRTLHMKPARFWLEDSKRAGEASMRIRELEAELADERQCAKEQAKVISDQSQEIRQLKHALRFAEEELARVKALASERLIVLSNNEALIDELRKKAAPNMEPGLSIGYRYSSLDTYSAHLDSVGDLEISGPDTSHPGGVCIRMPLKRWFEIGKAVIGL